MTTLPTRWQVQLRSLAIMVGVVGLVVAVAFVALYRATLERAETDLQQLVAGQATLIERIYAGESARTGDSIAAREHALSDLAGATLEFRDFGNSGELVVAERRGDSIHFLLPERNRGNTIPAPIAIGAIESNQLQRGVQGETGVARGPDYRGVEVVGAYRHLPLLGVGMVAKVDVAELRAPYQRSALYALLAALVVILVGTQLHLMIVGPLVGQMFSRAKSLEGELRVADATTERYATLVRSAPDPILVEDLDGKIIEVNAAAALAFGYAADDMIGQPIERFLPTEDPARLALLRRRAAHGEDVRDEERTATRRDLRLIRLLVSLAPLRDEHGKVVAISSLCKDITALEAARSALESQNKSLEVLVSQRTTELERELQVARALAAEARRGQEVPLLGESAAVLALREAIVTHAAHDEAVLLAGPIGAGQEAVARAIHERSDRAHAPFLVLDCSRALALETPSGVVNEGASSLRGLLNAARGGTLYLEHADQLDGEQQELVSTQLDRAGSGTPDHVRLIVYVTGDLAIAMTSGRVRPELASRLNRHRITVPALAERRDDIVFLAEHLLLDRARALGKPAVEFSDTARARLREHDWPGNVRELNQVVEALVRQSTGNVVEVTEPLGGSWRRVGGYRLVSAIGRGGMGEVWRAEHTLLKRPAAVKLMRRTTDMTPQDRAMLEARFRREAEVTSTLNSPHTVQMFDYGVTDEGEFFYVMELLEGMSLAELIRLENGMTPARAVYLLRQACLSLAEAHTRGLVHRDIKPDNLFVCRWIAQTDFLKVLDFGIVKRVGESGTMATAQGLAIGTPSYMAPEIAQGGEATMASDLYSLGCVLYRMLTGKRVFEVDGGQMQQMMAHIERTPVPPSEIALRAIPRELDALVLALLEKDPARRVGTAMQLYERLGALKLLDSWTESDALDWWETRERGVRA